MIRICPICNKKYASRPALSRKDNKTEICPTCGAEEAIKAAGLGNTEDAKEMLGFIQGIEDKIIAEAAGRKERLC